MMRILSPKAHGYLDYLVVVIFLCAPLTLHLSLVPAILSYALSGIHLALTLLTDFPMGVIKIVPLKWHGMIELVVGPVLIFIPFTWGFTVEPAASFFYSGTGIVIASVWLMTDYGDAKKA